MCSTILCPSTLRILLLSTQQSQSIWIWRVYVSIQFKLRKAYKSLHRMALLLFSPLELANKAAMLAVLMIWCRLTAFSYEGSRWKVALSNEPNMDTNRTKQTKQHATLNMMIRCGVTCTTYWFVCPWLCTDVRWTCSSEMSPATCQCSTKAVP
jgi:hypothetical protein